MATIVMKKLREANDIAYYIIDAKDYGCNDFFMSVNKKNRALYFYKNNNFSVPCKIIYDKNGKYEESGELPEVPNIVLYKAAHRALKMLDQEKFPDIDGWTSCGR